MDARKFLLRSALSLGTVMVGILFIALEIWVLWLHGVLALGDWSGHTASSYLAIVAGITVILLAVFAMAVIVVTCCAVGMTIGVVWGHR